MEKIKNQIKFTVVIPTYNRAGFIKNTIESVLRQDYRNFELIVVDDGSTDNTEEIVNFIKDERLFYFKKNNEERGAARNFGIRKATGDYVTFLDSDDYYHCNHLSALAEIINNYPGINFFATKYGFLRNNKYHPSPMHHIKEAWYDFNYLLKGNPFACNFCIRRNNPNLFLFEEDRSLSIMEDWLFLLKNMYNDKFFVKDKTTVTVNDHDERSMRSSNEIIINKRITASKWITDNFVLSNLQSKILAGYSHYFYAIHHYLSGDRMLVFNDCIIAFKNLGFKTKILSIFLKSLLGRKTLHVLFDRMFFNKDIFKLTVFKKNLRFVFYYLMFFSGILYYLRKINKNKLTVLCFHRITKEPTYVWPAMTKKSFSKILRFIKRKYTVISIEELDKKCCYDKPPVIITFDDGYKDFIENALEIIEEVAVPVVMNVVTDTLDEEKFLWSQRLNDILRAYLFAGVESFSIFFPELIEKTFEVSFKNIEKLSINLIQELSLLNPSERTKIIDRMEKNYPLSIKKTPMMNWQDLIYCSSKGILIGSHSSTHEHLDHNLNESVLFNEIFQSKKRIEMHINKSINIFTFPSGKYADVSVRYAVNSGFKYLLTTDEELLSIKDYVNKDNSYFMIPRITIQGNSFIENIFRIENLQALIKKNIKKNE